MGPDPSGKNIRKDGADFVTAPATGEATGTWGWREEHTPLYGGGTGQSRVLGIVGAAMPREVLAAAR